MPNDPNHKKRKRNQATSQTSKRRREENTNSSDSNRVNASNPGSNIDDNLDTSKPTAVFQPSGGRPWTLSVALPGSIIRNSKSLDSKTFQAGSIARALAVFCVDEIVVFDDGEEGREAAVQLNDDAVVRENIFTAFSHPGHFLTHVLSFLETPPFMRHALFPLHDNLKKAGALPSLDIPHHLRADEWCPYREAIAVSSIREGTFVDTGSQPHKFIRGVDIPAGTRVTVRMEPSETAEVRDEQKASGNSNGNEVEAVAPSMPREEAGYYWGYNVRKCGSLSAVFEECPFDGGYDLSIGTSERGEPLDEVVKAQKPRPEDFDSSTPRHRHLLLVFGGVAGLETAAHNDQQLRQAGIGKTRVKELFDHWVNVLPGQGSRTIRTEEAVWMGLMGIRGLLDR